MRRTVPCRLLALLACTGIAIVSLGSEPRQASDAKPAVAEGGLCVVVPAADADQLVERTHEGRTLVHGLALDDAGRDRLRAAIMAKSVHGLVSVATWRDRGVLPYASNLVNLLVVDLDALGMKAPPRAELERVVAPFGVLQVRQGGKWESFIKPRPREFDDWAHFDYGADGNAVSHDRAAGPPRLPQWISGVQANPFEGNPAGYNPAGGLRVSGRYALLDVDLSYDYAGKRDRTAGHVLQCRDAFNGAPLWSIPRDNNVADRRWSLVAAGDRAYAYLKAGSALTALDLPTGKPVLTFAGTAPPDQAGRPGGLLEETTCVRVAGDRLVVALGDRLLGFDARTGQREWLFQRQGKFVLAPSLAGDRVYVVVAAGAKDGKVFAHRWPQTPTAEAVVALDAATGKVVWENTDVASKPLPPAPKNNQARTRGIGQLLPADKFLVVFGSCAISGGSAPFVASLDLATGKTVHLDDQPVPIAYNSSVYNALVRDGTAYFAGAFTNFWRYDVATGKTEKAVGFGFNQRCTRLTATDRYFLFGQAAYWDAAYTGEQVCVARSGCAIGNVPANGMTYFTPNACGCITQMRGFQALTSETPPPALPEASRLVKGAGPAPALPATTATSPPGLIGSEWARQVRAPMLETAAAKAGALDLVAVVHQHRLEARSEGRVKWAFVADGRISSPPVVVNDSAIFGSHDGWVYAVNVADGSLRWKYLAAPSERLWSAYGQLESTWPVYGVTLFDGRIIASAGTHAELSGGVSVVALEPATGALVWRKQLAKKPSVVPPGGKGAHILAYSFLNSVPRIEQGFIVLGDGGRKGGEFRFRPDETEQAVNERLNAPPMKK